MHDRRSTYSANGRPHRGPLAGLALLAALTSTFTPGSAAASVQLEVDLPSGVTVPVTRYAASGNRVLLWLPSEFGVRQPQQQTAQALAKRGVEVWVIDLHAAYFVPVGRQSIASFDPEDVSELISIAASERPGTLFIAATGRGAQIALAAARGWQEAHGGTQRIGGIILFHPYLYASPPRPGMDPELVPGARSNNLPIYLIQPTLSAKHYRTESMAAALGAGGGSVFVHALPGVTDGFHLRSAADLSKADLAARKALPGSLARALRLLETQPRPAIPGVEVAQERVNRAYDPVPTTGLVPLGRHRPAPPLQLPDLQSNPRALEDYRGRVVLLSFWTSWCPPCIEELPSLHRLAERLRDLPFDIVSVNVGEDLSTVRRFVAEHRVTFPVLHDADGSTVGDWQVYAYPSNYLVDAAGLLRFGHVGALDWDRPEIARIIESLTEAAP